MSSPELQTLIAALQAIAAHAPASAIPASIPQPPIPIPVPQHTFDTVLAGYLASSQFRSLAPASREPYRRVMSRWVRREGLGSRPIGSLGRREIEAMLERQTQGAAHDLLKKIRVLLRFAISRGYRDDDPTPGIKAPPIAKGHATWNEDEIAQYRAYWRLGTRERLAFELALCTSQRRGDLVRMRWEHIRRGRLSLTQHKTGTPLSIPIAPDLQTALDAMKGTREGPLLKRSGRPRGRALAPEAFGNLFAKWIEAVGLGEHLVLHGLRKAAARQLAEAGCSEKEIAAVTGHRSLGEVARYTRAASQERLADQAMARLGRRC